MCWKYKSRRRQDDMCESTCEVFKYCKAPFYANVSNKRRKVNYTWHQENNLRKQQHDINLRREARNGQNLFSGSLGI